MSKDIFEEIFARLDKWRGFPAYKLEPRVDIFFSLYLKEVVERKLGVEITGIIPEFPIRQGSLKTAPSIAESTDNLSFKADYLLVSTDRAFLLELKTDQGSVNNDQIEYLLSAEEKGLDALVVGVSDLYRKTNSKEKYVKLMDEIKALGFPCTPRNPENTQAGIDRIDIIYVVPDAEKFKESAKKVGEKINKSTAVERIHVICFEYFSETLRMSGSEEDVLRDIFSDHLIKWKNNPV